MNPKLEEIRLHVEGRVQGVGYRASAQKAAGQAGLVGWVRNEPDGRVEICAQGSAEAIDAFLDWCKKGPPLANVIRIEIYDRRPLPDATFESFDVTR